MIKRVLTITTLILAFSLVFESCQKDPIIYQIGEEISIGFNKSIDVYDNDQVLEIRFSSLVNESRCPPDVKCTRAGTATIEIEVNNEEVFLLETCFPKPDCTILNPYIAEYNGYKIELNAVTYEKDRHFGNESKYSIYIIIYN